VANHGHENLHVANLRKESYTYEYLKLCFSPTGVTFLKTFKKREKSTILHSQKQTKNYLYLYCIRNLKWKRKLVAFADINGSNGQTTQPNVHDAKSHINPSFNDGV